MHLVRGSLTDLKKLEGLTSNKQVPFNVAAFQYSNGESSAEMLVVAKKGKEISQQTLKAGLEEIFPDLEVV